MNHSCRILSSALICTLLLPLDLFAQFRSSITFRNGSGEGAVVKLVGPTARAITIPSGTERVEGGIAPGRYYIIVRYGDEGRYSYNKGDPFVVEESGDSYSEMSITLHRVANGNYGSRPARRDEFDSPK